MRSDRCLFPHNSRNNKKKQLGTSIGAQPPSAFFPGGSLAPRPWAKRTAPHLILVDTVVVSLRRVLVRSQRELVLGLAAYPEPAEMEAAAVSVSITRGGNW